MDLILTEFEIKTPMDFQFSLNIKNTNTFLTLVPICGVLMHLFGSTKLKIQEILSQIAIKRVIKKFYILTNMMYSHHLATQAGACIG